MKRFNGIIFDFDYTLVDSSEGAVECINYAFKKLNIPIPNIEKAKRTIGLSLYDTFHELGGNQALVWSEKFARYFIERAEEVMVDLTVIFEYIPKVLRKLKSSSIKLGIVSTKFRNRIESVLRRENLLDLFDVIIGGEDTPKHKPNPISLLMALKKLQLPSTDILFIGDSVTDAETASRADIEFIAVLSGVTPRNAFKKYNTHVILEDLSELPSILGI